MRTPCYLESAKVLQQQGIYINLAFTKWLIVVSGDGGHLESLNGNGDPTPGSSLPYMHNQVQTLEWIRDSIAAFTLPARALQTLYYGKPTTYSYYTGCSTGGAQAFALAQRHPDLFDGIYAGSPGNWYTHLVLMFLWNYQRSQGPAFMDQQTLDFLQAAVLEQCDALDGVNDGILEDPSACDFNISSLRCSDGQSERVNNRTECLTTAQISAARAFYQGPKDSRNGKPVYPGFMHGSESSWLMLETVLANIYSAAVLQNLVFSPSFNISQFNWGSDVDQVDLKAGTMIDHISTDMRSFLNRGGKIIMSQGRLLHPQNLRTHMAAFDLPAGYSDPLNPPGWPIEYLSQIANVTENLADSMRLFMVPGGGHCGPSAEVPQAPNTIGYFQPLMNWVEKGQPPMQLKVSNPMDGSNRTRKLCPWPQKARFDGGNSDSWVDFSCT